MASVDEHMKRIWCIYRMERNDICGKVLGEISQTQNHRYPFLPFLCRAWITGEKT